MPKAKNNAINVVDAAIERIEDLKKQVGSGKQAFGIDQAATDLVLSIANGDKRLPESVYRCNFDALIQKIHSCRSQLERLTSADSGGTSDSTDMFDTNEALDPAAQDDALNAVITTPFKHKKLSINNPDFEENARLYIKMCESGIFGAGKADDSLIAILKQQITKK